MHLFRVLEFIPVFCVPCLFVFNQSTWFPRVSQSRIGQLHLYEMDVLYPPSIVAIVDNLFSYPYLRFVVEFSFIALRTVRFLGDISVGSLGFILYSFSSFVGFGMTITHSKAAVFTARRFELLEVVSSTLTYLHPDSRVHSFLSPLPYQV